VFSTQCSAELKLLEKIFMESDKNFKDTEKIALGKVIAVIEQLISDENLSADQPMIVRSSSASIEIHFTTIHNCIFSVFS
jgi:hypothetical protein